MEISSQPIKPIRNSSLRKRTSAASEIIDYQTRKDRDASTRKRAQAADNKDTSNRIVQNKTSSKKSGHKPYKYKQLLQYKKKSQRKKTRSPNQTQKSYQYGPDAPGSTKGTSRKQSTSAQGGQRATTTTATSTKGTNTLTSGGPRAPSQDTLQGLACAVPITE